MTNWSFWNNFNKPSRKTKYQSRLQILLWDGSQLEKSFHTKEYQTHSSTGRVKFTQSKLSRWNYFIITLCYICFKAIEHFKRKGTKISTCTLQYPWMSVTNFKNEQRKKTMKLISNGPRGGLQIVAGWEFTSVRVSYHV